MYAEKFTRDEGNVVCLRNNKKEQLQKYKETMVNSRNRKKNNNISTNEPREASYKIAQKEQSLPVLRCCCK